MSLIQQNILIADGTLTDLNVLLADLPTRMQVVRVTSAAQALAAFWQALATPGLRQLHVLAHGEPGAVAFAGQRLTAADFVRRFDGAAQRDLDLAFWSCRTGEGEAGKAFVHALAQATGARVAASERLIGNGYWALTPAIVPPFAIEAREAYEHTLPTQPSFISPAFYQDAERGEAAQSVNLGDLNEDGLVDIQAASRDMYGAENLTSTLLNDGGGTGTFTAVFNLPGAANGVSQHTRLADMNSDGHLDFVAMTTMPSKDLVISWGAGTGQYTAYAKPLNGVANLLAWDDFTVADVDGDGKMDLVLAGESNGQTTISVLTGTGNGVFASTPTSLAIETAGVNVVQHIEAADLNQDGYADLVTTRSDGRTSVSFGSANGLTLSQIYPSSSFNNTDGDALALADVNHDGKLDMISAIDSIQTVTVRLNQGNGTFGAATFNALNGLGMVTSLAVGDVNQDGNQDIVVATDMGSPQVLLNTGTGTFSTPVNLPGAVTGSVDVALGDVNQDGKLDVVTALMSGEVGVWLNSTAASDTTAPTFASASVNGATVVLTLNDANALDASATAPLSAYSVKVNGVAAALTGSPVVNASAKTVTLTLANAVTPDKTVSVSYTDPSSSNDANALQDIAGNDVATISNFVVSNLTPNPGPTLISAVINSQTLVLSYSDVDGLSAQTAPLSAFAVQVNGTPVALTGSPMVNTTAKTITLMLVNPVSSTQSVQVAYTDPSSGNDANAVQDNLGNDAASLAYTLVTNQTLATNSGGPTFVSATVSYDKLVLSFADDQGLSQTLDDYMSGIPAEQFTIKIDGVMAYAVSSPVVDSASKQVTIQLNSVVRANSVVTVSYQDPTTGNDVYALQDASGNDAASFGPAAVTVTTPVDNDGPVLNSASVEGNFLTLHYTDASPLAGVPGTAFNVQVDGVAMAALLVEVIGADQKDLKLTLAAPVEAGQTVTISYAPTAYVSVKDALGNPAAAFSQFVVNNQTSPTYQLSATEVNYTLPAGNIYTVRGNALDNTLTGNANANALYGGDGNDILNGGYSDWLYGENGNDTLISTSSSTSLFGGAGHDRYQLTTNSGESSMISRVVEAVGQGVDTVVFNHTSTSYSPVSLTLPDNVENLIALGNVGFISGNQANNYVVGSSTQTNTINGLAGNDTLVGQGGNDTLSGGDGNDVLSAVLNTSQLNAEMPRVLTGNITLTGDAGADTFVLAEGYVGDYRGSTAGGLADRSLYISDFQRGVDKIHFTLAENASAPTTLNTLSTTTLAGFNSALAQAASLGSAATPAVTAITYNSNTYLVLDQSDGNTFSTSSDLVFRVNGTTAMTLADLSFAKLSQFNPLQQAEFNPPVLLQASVDDHILTLSYADASPLSLAGPDSSTFNVLVNGVTNAVSAVAIDSLARTVKLTLGTPVLAGQNVTVAYTDPSAADDANAIQDSLGNDAASFAAVTVSNLTVPADTTAPVLSSANVNGAMLTLGYTELNALDTAHGPALTAFTVKVNGAIVALTGSPVVNASAKTVTLTLANAVTPDKTVSVSYTDPSSSNDVNAVQDITGNDASSISNFAVSNQTTSGVYTLGVTQANYTASGSYNLDIIGNALNNSIAGNSGANLIDGGNGNDVLNGGNGNDTLLGGTGKDTLTGGLGVDSLAGGADNDIYYVDNSDDVISEEVTGGVDIVYASASYVLSANVEGLNLQGSANLSGTGNALANTMNGNTGDNMLTGLDGNDVLDGKQGADTLVGGQGSDTYYLDNAGDQIIELAGEGVDVVFTSVSYTMADNVENMRATAIGLTLVGNALNNLIYGSTGQDALIDGGAGNDIIYSQGNDMGATEVVQGGAGNDTIYVNGFTASGNYGSYVYGDDGNDTLDASVGDVQSGLYGGTGNDTYIINNLNNAVIEDSNAGIDTVKSSVTFSLQYGEFLVPNYGSLSTVSDDVENLTLTGTGNINGLGNALANYILGNTGSNLLQGRDGNDQLIGQGGDDTLEGGAGNDVLAPVTHTSSTGAPRVLTGQITLTGGAGSDVFWMTQGYVGDHSSGANTLNITDFVHGADKIKLTLGASVTLPTSVTTLTPGTGATLSSLLNQASSSATAATTPKVTVFSFSGDTYLVLDQSNATTFASGDLAIKLTGVQTVSFSDLAFVKM
ncbi:SwmB domain-containing protein [Rivihabitans pingtungensis]|uniref:SwmB domain-containing protein n=1 Tax=Rivihabitans pingtungensis TaxID=1054498 RepID=UPI00235256D0|nr:SwmB domain-containing protein [Rivihabitans pingtungensis]MCK6436132.1 FG-GAP-like repeat-containing protein [Rivihabitans pingtungensis]